MMLFMGSVWFITPVHGQVTPVLDVAVAVSPVAGIVEEVGGVYIETSILLDEGVEPHAFTVTPQLIAAADAADLLVLTGHFEWEHELANQTTTPFITMHDEDALESFEDYGAEFSEIPGHHEEDHDHVFLAQDDHDHEGNPHAWWLLPQNALAIANATRAGFTTLHVALEDVWSSNFDVFVADVAAFLDLVETQDSTYHFSNMHAVCVFPAEAYVAEAFGIEVLAVLQVEGLTISGDELLEVQEAMSNGTVSLVLGSDVAQLQAGGEFAEQLVSDYNGTLIWWRAVYFGGFNDYLSVMTYNLGSLVSGLEERPYTTADSPLILLFGGLAAILAVVVVIEGVVIFRKASA
jgi:ABC-type Zn uptake system ZnuABC Zn-binding protein ZnuA